MQMAAAQFLAPRWPPAVLAAVHEEFAVRIARLGGDVSAPARRAAVVSALEPYARRDVRAHLRLRHHRAAMSHWRGWVFDYVQGVEPARDPADIVDGPELDAFLAALAMRWSQIASGLNPAVVRTR